MHNIHDVMEYNIRAESTNLNQLNGIYIIALTFTEKKNSLTFAPV